MNTGLKASDAPYVVTLNSDTIVTSYWLDGLIRCLRSDPTLGITGPLSNAASWQNVPDLRDPDGSFAVNALPAGITPEDMADIVRSATRRIYPRSPFVNGFCFMLRREVLEAVGYMDEGAFPTGYGEENDFCIRAQDAGFGLAYADDTYVFHAKSKSFGNDRRRELSRAGNEAIRAKHGDARFNALLRKVSDTALMDELRATVRTAMARRSLPSGARAIAQASTQKVLFILPVRGGGGGAHSVVQEVAGMRAIGIEAKVAVRAQDLDDFMRLYGDIDDARALFAPFTDDTLIFVARDFDIAVATIFTSVPYVARITRALPWVMPAYYIQDYEPMFFPEGSEMWQQAHDSYTAIPGMLAFAKTHWIGQTVESRHGVQVHKVEPSIDHEVYNLTGPRLDHVNGRICITAMIRPRTPRRGAKRTMQLLARLKASLGDDIALHLFGCDPDDPDFLAMPRDFEFQHHGILTRPEVATLLRSADLFIDMSDYQAFGRTGLEAMACGALAAVPEAGGGREYAVDDVNALMLDTLDVDACFERLRPLLADRTRMGTMRLAALETASRYSPRRAAQSELLLFAPALEAWRNTHPKPQNRPRLLLMADPAATPEAHMPGQGNERLPMPYCQAGLIADWDIRAEPAETLPAVTGGGIALLQGNPTARHGAAFAEWLEAWRARRGKLVYDIGSQTGRKLVDAALVEAADRIVTSTPTAAARLLTRHPAASGKITVLPTYPDRDIWMRTPPVARCEEPLTIGYIGARENHADLQRIAPALAAMATEHGVETRIIGTYQDQKLTPAAGTRLSYPRRRNDPDFRFDELVAWLKEVADWPMFILPDAEAPALKFMRAATLGGAIVCAAHPELDGLARDGENCLVVAGDDVAAWQGALIRLATDPVLRRTLAETAWKEAESQFVMQAQTGQYAQLLREILHES